MEVFQVVLRPRSRLSWVRSVQTLEQPGQKRTDSVFELKKTATTASALLARSWRLVLFSVWEASLLAGHLYAGRGYSAGFKFPSGLGEKPGAQSACCQGQGSGE